MFFASWLRNGSSTRDRSRPPACPRLSLESLDGRLLPSTLTVTTLGDSGAGSLRAEIAAARSGDVINFDPSLAGGTVALGGDELFIDKSLTVNGPAGGVVIDGGYQSRLFEVAIGASVNLSFLTLTRGNGRAHFSDSPAVGGHNGSGGAILNFGSVSVGNCTLSDNTATDFGGAVYTAPHVKQVKASGALYLWDTDVTGNRAGFGGGIYVDGGALWAENSAVSGNVANYSGGGIWVGGKSTATLNNCTVSGNTAEGYDAGGIYNAGTLTTDSGTSVIGNTAAGDGGGLYNLGQATLNNTIVTGNVAGDQGGGIYNSSAGVLTLNGTSVTGNTAPAGPDTFLIPPASKKGRA